jgi:putative hydrolase of the HAD superfamily
VKVVVFDLDDTLYEELSYVQSGFRAVSREMAKVLGAGEKELYDFMWKVLMTHGRGRVFDETAVRYCGRPLQRIVRRCLSIYRLHKPDIRLLPDAEQALKRLGDTPVYIVTDGNKLVQQRKIEALGLHRLVTGYYITHRFGLRYAKPSPYCFLKIRDRERVPASEIVYVGDNPRKDFIGIKPLGFRTIRIRRGPYRDLVLPDAYEAEAKVDDLTEIFNVFREWRD